jgi:hypothetical protein
MVGWPHCFGAFSKAVYHGKEQLVEQSYLPQGQDEKKRKKKVLGPFYPFQGHDPNDQNSHYTPSLHFPPPHNSSNLGTKTLTHRSFDLAPKL